MLARLTKFWCGSILQSPEKERVSVPFMRGLMAQPHAMEGQVLCHSQCGSTAV